MPELKSPCSQTKPPGALTSQPKGRVRQAAELLPLQWRKLNCFSCSFNHLIHRTLSEVPSDGYHGRARSLQNNLSSSQEKLVHTAVPLCYSKAFPYRKIFISSWAVFFFRSADFSWQKPHGLLSCYFWLFLIQLNPLPPPHKGCYMLPYKLPTLEVSSFTAHLINGDQEGTRGFSVWCSISACLICESREYCPEEKNAIPAQILTLWR